MNKLDGKILRIESSDAMSLVEVNVDGDTLSALLLETSQTAAYLTIGGPITLLFKETEVAIAKNLFGLISLRNRLKGTIKKIEKAKILAKVVLNYKDREIVSIITSASAEKLDLKPGEEVEWLVKANEISLSPKEN